MACYHPIDCWRVPDASSNRVIVLSLVLLFRRLSVELSLVLSLVVSVSDAVLHIRDSGRFDVFMRLLCMIVIVF